MGNDDFTGLIRRIRAGDEDAARELVLRFEPQVRQYFRKRLRQNGHLSRVFDSADLSQSVLGKLFEKLGEGQFDLASPEDLARLLTTMARNKFLTRAEAEQTAKRGHGRVVPLESAPLDGLVSPVPTPSRIVSADELEAKLRDLLTPFERFLAEQRADGRSWQQIAADVHHTAEALRKRLVRAYEQAAKQLGLHPEEP